MAERRSFFLSAVAIVALTLLAYANSFSGPLVFDDSSSVAENMTIRDITDLRAVLSPALDSTVGGRPVANFSFALNYWLSGEDVWSYHALNLAFHLGSVLLLFACVRRTLAAHATNALAGASARPTGEATWSAGLIAVVWAVHPLLTSAVSYVSQRTELLMGLCYLGTLYCFIRGSEERPGLWLTLSVVVCGLGMASKEVMVTAPIAIWLYDRTFISGSFREAWRRRTGYYGALVSTWLLLICLLAEMQKREVGFGRGVSWWRYALTESEAVLTYLRLALWPHPQSFDYGASFIAGITAALPFLSVLVALLVATGWALVRWPAIGFPTACFFLILAPTSSVVPVALQPIAENRAYLPAACVVTLVVLGSQALAGKRARWFWAAAALGLAGLTAVRNAVFADPVALWREAVARRPGNARAHLNLGHVLDLQGKEEARKWYQSAIALDPRSMWAHNNYASILVDLGRIDEAIFHARAALEIDPVFPMAHANLASALNRANKPEEALQHARQALRSRPSLAVAHFEAGNALLNLGRLAEALEHYEAEVKLRPAVADIHCNWGTALLLLGRLPEAIERLQLAVRLEPALGRAQHNLATAFLRAGKTEAAILHYRNAVQIDSQWYEARSDLGLALGRSGALDEAEKEFSAALALKPDYAPAVEGMKLIREARRPIAK